MQSPLPAAGGIIVGHGQFAAGLLSALRMILGDVADLEAVSTEGKARKEFEQAISALRARLDGRPCLVFADLRGGAGTTACACLPRRCPDVAIIAGVNLPMLVKFVQYRDELPFAELCDVLVRTGREAVQVVSQVPKTE